MYKITKPTVDQITHQCNLIHIAQRYGYTPSEDIRELAKGLLEGVTPLNHPIYTGLKKHKEVLDVFIRHLQRTLKPLLFGISRKWKLTQDELLRATIKTFERGYVRPLSEVPTGSGKSMYIGALVRAALDTIKELNLDEEVHILTSRIAIAGQLIYEEVPQEQEEDRPLDLGKKGDVRIWCPELGEDKIRLLAGKNGQKKSEREKDALLTVSTYQGLSVNRIDNCFKKKAFIVICDESHRVTERVALIVEQMKTMICGMSATVIGPERDPFFFFERIERPETNETKKRKTYVDYLNYHKSIVEMVKDRELKSVRWINARHIKIDVSEAQLRNSSKGIYDVFNDTSVSKILSKNPEIGAEVIAEAYLGNHPGLLLSGSKPVHKRRGIVFVDRIATAALCATACNNILPAKLHAKYGPDTYFKAGYVDGTMSEHDYNAVMSDFRKGIITLIFSAEKVGEGVDLPFVDLIIPLRVFGLGSQWKLVQALGRGIRIDPNDPFGDLVVLDMVFVSDKHLLASVLGIFGRSSLLSGGLLASWGSNYELEAKVFELLRKAKSWTDVWKGLTPEEQILFPYIQQKMEQEKARSGHGVFKILSSHTTEPMFALDSIEFIEQEDVRLALSLGNHDEMVKYAMEVLTECGYPTIDHLIRFRDHSLPLFAKRRFERFRDGLTMVNLVLQENKTLLTSSHMTLFIELLRSKGFPVRTITRTTPVIEVPSLPTNSDPVRHPKPETNFRSDRSSTPKKRVPVAPQPKVVAEISLESIITKMQDLFGVEPEFATTFRDLYGKPVSYTGQATIALPEGLKFNSMLHKHEDETRVKQKAAIELDRLISLEIKNRHILLQRGSEWYNNHLKIPALIMHEYQFSKPIYTITERNGIFVVQAMMEKHKMKITGSPAVNRVEGVAKKHAEVSLARELMNKLASCANSADVTANMKMREKLGNLCTQMRIQYHTQTKEVQVGSIKICEARLSAYGLSAHACGITRGHATEKAAGDLYTQLLQFTGGRQTQNN